MGPLCKAEGTGHQKLATKQFLMCKTIEKRLLPLFWTLLPKGEATKCRKCCPHWLQNQDSHLPQVGKLPFPTWDREAAVVAARGQTEPTPVPKPSQTRSQMTHILIGSQLPSL